MIFFCFRSYDIELKNMDVIDFVGLINFIATVLKKTMNVFLNDTICKIQLYLLFYFIYSFFIDLFKPND